MYPGAGYFGLYAALGPLGAGSGRELAQVTRLGLIGPARAYGVFLPKATQFVPFTVRLVHLAAAQPALALTATSPAIGLTSPESEA